MTSSTAKSTTNSARSRPHFLTYPLVDGYVHHWLTVGPYDQRTVTAPRREEAVDAFRARILTTSSMPAQDYVNVTELDRVQLGEKEQHWEVAACQEDHILAWHGYLPTYTYRQAWGYLHLTSVRAQTVTLHLTTNCGARLWLNGKPVLQSPNASFRGVFDEESPPSPTGREGIPPGGRNDASASDGARAEGGEGREILRFAQNDKVTQNDMAAYSEMATIRVTVKLAAGANPLLMRLEDVGIAELSLMATLRIEQQGKQRGAINVQLPTLSRAPRRRQRLDAIFAATRLDRAVYTKSDAIRLIAPVNAKNAAMQLRLQKASGAIYAETLGTLKSGEVIESVAGSQLPDGPLDAVVMAPFQAFYNDNLRARHTHPILISNQPFYRQPSSHSADERLVEALAAQAHSPLSQSNCSSYAELAKMAFGLWDKVDAEAIHTLAERVIRREAGMLPDLLGLITMVARMPAYRGFPQAILPDLNSVLTSIATPDDNALAAWESGDEVNQLLLMAARHLTAQLLPGTPVNPKGADALVAWMAARGRSGFRHWHSQHDLWVMALAPLVSLAQEESVREMAATLLDQLAFALAIHSFRGVFGASRAVTTPAALRSGRFAPEAALTRLLWGVGGYQTGAAAATSLGLAGISYTLPDVVRTIALAQPEALWVRERHGDARVVSYKTPDYLLSSTQSYCTGESGSRAHLWQATLGPEALVFCNHPANMSQDVAASPGWWVGNGTLPAIAQHHDSLIARYALPAGDWPGNTMGFTHAYFPTYAFDEHAFVEGWAFARVGEGYLALGASPAFTSIEHGPDAGRELRVVGRAATWLCQMGRRALDGDFANFQRKVLSSAPQHHEHEQGVTWTTLRGEALAFGMDGNFTGGNFTVNGQAVSLADFPRHNSPFGQAPFPADHLDIVHGEEGLRLHF